jgi:Ca2+-binding EF-hand superfamily protein
MYAAFTLQQVKERWARIETEVNEKKESFDAEYERHEQNDRICKDFAVKSKAFLEIADRHRDELAKGTGGELQDQLNAVAQKRDAIGGLQAELTELAAISHTIDERNIIFNAHTDVTIETLNLTYDKLIDLAAKQQALIEREIINRSGSGVTPEQLTEFRETFQHFDKDKSGRLDKLEFKACLSALGQNVTDEQVEALINNLGKTETGHIVFEEFVQYMIAQTSDSDSPDTIKKAFKTIAQDRDYVTEEELRKYMDRDSADYLVANIPNHDGKFDYASFTDKNYVA